MYITHARTAEELRQEVVSDLRRRLGFLDSQKNLNLSRAELSRIHRAINELEDLLSFWDKVKIQARPKRSQKDQTITLKPTVS